MTIKDHSEFVRELTDLINKHSMENGSDTPDHILAGYLHSCLSIFDYTLNQSNTWHRAAEEE